MNHATFKARYTCRHYHGDPSYGGPYGDRQTGTITVEYYYADTRTIMDDGTPMVVWAKIADAATTVPGFLNGYTREDALALRDKFASEVSHV
jgi:hypothetical protein